ncbi:MAG: 2-C-methyl-D-erythritol 4-phosphate cytidylyltransferase [Caldisericaceae bacterium]
MKISAIIAAAGKGKRFNGGTDKVFLPINGTPLILMSLEVLLSVPEIDEVVIALNRNNMALANEYLRFDKVSFVEGGEERLLSVQNAVFKSRNDFVLIHDAARPLITKSFVESIISGLSDDSDGVIPVVSVKSTIKEKDEEGFVRKTIPRRNLVEVQTPQFFRKDILLKAYQSEYFNLNATDESSIVEDAGGKVKTIKGIEENIKVTTPFDYFMVDKIIEQWKKE